MDRGSVLVDRRSADGGHARTLTRERGEDRIDGEKSPVSSRGPIRQGVVRLFAAEC